MHSPAYRTWKKRIEAYDAGIAIPKSIIRALCRRMAENFHENPDDLNDLLNRGIAWYITQKQKEQGLKWLHRPAVLRQMGDKERRILGNFSHFLFVGTREVQRGYGYRDTAPIYRVCGGPGEYFDYVPRPWQSGGPSFEIVR
jgi:hypothetical protein